MLALPNHRSVEEGGMSRRYIRKNRGFTLLEVLITAVISSVIVLGLIAGATGFFSRDSQEQQKIATQQRLRLVSNVLASDVRRAAYVYRSTDLQTIVDKVSGGVDLKGIGMASKLALLIPEADQVSNPGKFRLVIYALGPVPNTAPFNVIKSLVGNVIYRWYSLPSDFDPVAQTGSGKTPTQLEGNFLTYGDTAAVLPPLLTGNIGLLRLDPAGTYGSSASSVKVNIQASRGSDLTLTGAPLQLNLLLQPRNLGVPAVPLPPTIL
jgi:prepilin-type N-terminal cleavage/methylation domain-containing protein